MTLLSRIPGSDTISGFERAWEARLKDADGLKKSKRNYWGVYTLGYVAEMALKAACFRCQGVPANADLSVFLKRRRAEQWAAMHNLSKPANLHDLVFWAQLLVALRAAGGRPLPLDVSNGLLIRIGRIARNWRESMRYHSGVSASKDFRSAKGHVEWIVRNYPALV